MLISFVVPVFNRAHTLVRCLSSIEDNMAGGDYEVIIVDDGSSDDSVALAERLCKRNSRFRLLKHRHNQGTNAARNTGLREVRGEWVLLLDADDELCLDGARLEALLTEYAEESWLAFRCIDDDGNLVGPEIDVPRRLDLHGLLHGEKDFDVLNAVRPVKDMDHYFDSRINGFEGIGWVRLMRQLGRLTILPVVALHCHQDAGNQLSNCTRRQISGNHALGHIIFIRENWRDMPLSALAVSILRTCFFAGISLIYNRRLFK